MYIFALSSLSYMYIIKSVNHTSGLQTVKMHTGLEESGSRDANTRPCQLYCGNWGVGVIIAMSYTCKLKLGSLLLALQTCNLYIHPDVCIYM